MPGRWAAVTGAGRLRARGARALLAEAEAAGAALLVVADRASEEGAARLAALASSEASRVLALDPCDLAGAERGVAGALGREAGVSLLLALSACVRGAPRRPALAVAAARCNRCGACLGLACPGIHDPGDEAMAIDPAVCTGCGRCAPLCRSRAIAAPT
jgi:indolepyruvate ferredoxin oxidoreductase alpha subunit